MKAAYEGMAGVLMGRGTGGAIPATASHTERLFRLRDGRTDTKMNSRAKCGFSAGSNPVAAIRRLRCASSALPPRQASLPSVGRPNAASGCFRAAKYIEAREEGGIAGGPVYRTRTLFALISWKTRGEARRGKSSLSKLAGIPFGERLSEPSELGRETHIPRFRKRRSSSPSRHGSIGRLRSIRLASRSAPRTVTGRTGSSRGR